MLGGEFALTRSALGRVGLEAIHLHHREVLAPVRCDTARSTHVHRVDRTPREGGR